MSESTDKSATNPHHLTSSMLCPNEVNDLEQMYLSPKPSIHKSCSMPPELRPPTNQSKLEFNPDEEINSKTLPYLNISHSIEPFKPKLHPQFYYTPIQKRDDDDTPSRGDDDSCQKSQELLRGNNKVKKISSLPYLSQNFSEVTDATTTCTDEESDRSSQFERRRSPFRRNIDTDIVSPPVITKNHRNGSVLNPPNTETVEISTNMPHFDEYQSVVDFPTDLQIPDLDHDSNDKVNEEEVKLGTSFKNHTTVSTPILRHSHIHINSQHKLKSRPKIKLSMRPSSYFKSAMNYPESLLIPTLDCSDCLNTRKSYNDSSEKTRLLPKITNNDEASKKTRLVPKISKNDETLKKTRLVPKVTDEEIIRADETIIDDSTNEDLYIPVLSCGCGILTTYSDGGTCHDDNEFWRRFFP